jgi:hypothetical protein
LKNQDGGASLRLTYRSANGEEGYPGTVDVAVTYSVSDDNVFIVETDAETDLGREKNQLDLPASDCDPCVPSSQFRTIWAPPRG